MEDKAFENWETKKEYIKKSYPQIKDEDLVYRVGQEIEVIERLQKKLKKTKEEIHSLLSYIGYT